MRAFINLECHVNGRVFVWTIFLYGFGRAKYRQDNVFADITTIAYQAKSGY
jgi:hypothetical protein